MNGTADTFERWLESLRERYLAEMRFSDVTRALRALSADYVQRRDRPSGGLRGDALEGRGKRAAFALFYGPLHFLVVKQVADALGLGLNRARVVDLGCGTGSAGAALTSLGREAVSDVLGVDRQAWALDEAARTYRHFGARFRTVRARAADVRLPPGALVVAAYTINEFSEHDRTSLLVALTAHLDRRGSLLVVEPIARGVTPWWIGWQHLTSRPGARADEWRFQAGLPELLQTWDRAAGLDHREQTARSLWVPPSAN